MATSSVPSSLVWGSPETKYYFELTPDRILDAVEAVGVRCTGRCLTLNSMENRVYEVEVEVDDGATLQTPSDRFRVAKFYRPGRWSREQILEEHEFLAELAAQEVPVVAPLRSESGETLHQMQNLQIWYAVFPKAGGRIPDELSDEQMAIIGRLLARLHNTGASHSSKQRILLTPETYGSQNLESLLALKVIPAEVEKAYCAVVDEICAAGRAYFKDIPVQRLHGDCHLGNILWATQGPRMVDFDDMVVGPCVQDIWLLLPGRDLEAKVKLDILLEAYEQFRPFPRASLRLIEVLRALRLIHFSAWIARRWNDPAFKRAFAHFGTPGYWQGQLGDLEDQLRFIREGFWEF